MKICRWLFLIVAAVVMLTACAAQADTPEPGPEPEPIEGDFRPLRVGLSNTFMFPWRAQMIDNILREFEYYRGRGWVEGDLVIQHAGVDTSAQIAQIRMMVSDGIDVLIINPISADGLNEVVEEAIASGVTVVAFDQAITAQGVFNVTIDHYTWGYRFADWLAQAIDGQGDVVFIEGLPGHPANDDRVRGWRSALEKYPDITVVGTAVGGWDNPGAQLAASQLVATNPNLRGIISMDGMALGIFNALRAAGRLDSIVTTGETQVAVLREWAYIKEEFPEFQSFGVINPPGIGATALGFALRLARGYEFTGELVDGNTFFYEVTGQVDNSNFAEFYERFVVLEGRPDSYYPDEWLSSAQVDALFR